MRLRLSRRDVRLKISGIAEDVEAQVSEVISGGLMLCERIDALVGAAHALRAVIGMTSAPPARSALR